jgi:hypothetical protein
MGRVTTANGKASPEAQRAASIVEALGKSAGGEDVFAAFEQLDALPPEVVRSALTPWTGPAPDPQRLDARTRTAHGFPLAPLEVRTVRIVTPRRLGDLDRVAQEQVRAAGLTWDGQDLHAAARLAEDGSESSFAGTLEHRVVSDVAGKPLFDVVRYRGDSGAIFRAGTTEQIGAIAYGTVETRDRRVRVALQGALLTKEVDALSAAPLTAAAVERTLDAADDEAPVSSSAPTARGAKGPATAAKKAAAKKAAVKKTAVKKTASKKTAAKKAAAKKTAAKKTAVKKTAAKKTAVNKTAVKKTAVKKTAVKKTAAAE